MSNLLGFDFTSNGSKELLISRDDGCLELYAYDIDNQLKLQFKDQLKEGITAIQGGKFSLEGVSEFLTSTYSGKIIGLIDDELKDKYYTNSVK